MYSVYGDSTSAYPIYICCYIRHHVDLLLYWPTFLENTIQPPNQTKDVRRTSYKPYWMNTWPEIRRKMRLSDALSWQGTTGIIYGDATGYAPFLLFNLILLLYYTKTSARISWTLRPGIILRWQRKIRPYPKPSSQPVHLNYPIRGFNSASASGTTSRPQPRSCYGLHLASGYCDQGELTASTIL